MILKEWVCFKIVIGIVSGNDFFMLSWIVDLRFIEFKGSVVSVFGGIITFGGVLRRELFVVDVGFLVFGGLYVICVDVVDVFLLFSIIFKLIRICICMYIFFVLCCFVFVIIVL